jgi:hypothetical protein
MYRASLNLKAVLRTESRERTTGNILLWCLGTGGGGRAIFETVISYRQMELKNGNIHIEEDGRKETRIKKWGIRSA